MLKQTSLRLLVSEAVRHKRVLQQGDCKNAFCQAELPDDERIAVRPPVGDPARDADELWLLRKTLYGLRRSPKHWYNKFTSILQTMGLTPSVHDPCVYRGVCTDTDNPAAEDDRAEVHVGIYVDDFVFYSTDSSQEELFRKELGRRCTVDFMGDVDFFLGTSFTWRRRDDGHLAVHLCQRAFTEFVAHRFGVDQMHRCPTMTPYRSGLPIDAIPPPDADDPDQARRTKVYQRLVGSINWLATCTRPNIAPLLTFLATYNQGPSAQHYRSAIEGLRYLYSTADYGISFHSDADSTMRAFNHFPHHHDAEAYSDATPPLPDECHKLSAYCDACWGGQFGNSVKDGVPLELFKYRSLSGFLICRSGGPVAWKSVRQEQTALSSCEAEIVATNECTMNLEGVKHQAAEMGFPDASVTTDIYNDNQGCVDWSAAVTTKGIKHMNLKENRVRESQANGLTCVKHIPGKVNPSDIFTKEMKDAAHFRECRDMFMVSLNNFIEHGHVVPSQDSEFRLPPHYVMPTFSQ